MSGQGKGRSTGGGARGEPAGHGRRPQGYDDLRTSIADRAARLISEGMTDYHAAKQKAARQLGATDRRTLPDNAEIEAALKARIALFHADSHPAVIEALRRTALRAMRWLDRFHPWLTGPVLNGSAVANSPIELELIGAEPKSLEHFLLGERIDFETRSSHARGESALQIQYAIAFHGVPVVISLFDSHAQRQATHPRDSLRHCRAQLPEAERLLGGEVDR